VKIGTGARRRFLMGRTPMIFGEVGETLELVGVVITIFSSLAILVLLGKFWET
jgi:hypothetical protein